MVVFFFCCALLCVCSGFAIILMGKRELIALLGLSSWCLMVVVWLFLAVPWVCLQFVVVVFPDHTYLLHVFLTFWPGSLPLILSSFFLLNLDYNLQELLASCLCHLKRLTEHPRNYFNLLRNFDPHTYHSVELV